MMHQFEDAVIYSYMAIWLPDKVWECIKRLAYMPEDVVPRNLLSFASLSPLTSHYYLE